MLTKIDTLTMPNLQGKTVDQKIQLLYDHCFDVAKLVMQLNNEIIELQHKISKY
jgi:hypothetical protein